MGERKLILRIRGFGNFEKKRQKCYKRSSKYKTKFLFVNLDLKIIFILGKVILWNISVGWF